MYAAPPVTCGSLLDLTWMVEKETSAEQVNDLLRKWARGTMKGILAVEDRPIVSSDVIGTEESAIVSTEDTQVIGGRFPQGARLVRQRRRVLAALHRHDGRATGS